MKNKRNSVLKRLRKLHKWPALIISLFLFLFGASGIILNHRAFFASQNIPRQYLPSTYRYADWNLAAVKGALQLGADSLLLYGNIGIWKTDTAFSHFRPYNKGFKKGIDHRKITALLKVQNQLYAGTQFGLYRWSLEARQWQPVPYNCKEKRIVDLSAKNDSLYVLTRSYILSAPGQSPRLLRAYSLPPNSENKSQISLFKTLWELHSGGLFGLVGKLFVDFLGLVVILLTLSGLLYFLLPGIIRRRKQKAKTFGQLVRSKRGLLSWHNRIGKYLVFFLIITTFSGMFLRPPLLIPIAHKKINKIKYTHLDSPNPWFDQLRSLHYDASQNQFVIGTTSGFYHSSNLLLDPPKKFALQPPVSVMGVNVFHQQMPGTYLVGSFSGLYQWQPAQNYIRNYISGETGLPIQSMGPPVGKHPVSGYLQIGSSELIFDYNQGALVKPGTHFPQMPPQIETVSPMSLWNLALEVHTGRIFSPLIGPFYILYIPLCGLTLLLILISGYWMWRKTYHKNSNRKAPSSRTLQQHDNHRVHLNK